MHIPVTTALHTLQESGKLFVDVFTHGTLRAEVYKPVGEDLQQPHAQDEIYIVISGTGDFYDGQTTVEFQPGDFLFVPAGVDHRFTRFTEDFATWVVFFNS